VVSNFKRCTALLLVLAFALPTPRYCLADDAEPPSEMMDPNGTIHRERSEQTDTELFKAERELKEKLGKDPGNPEYYLELSNIYATLFDRNRKKKGRQAEEWLWRSGDALEKAVMIDPENKVAHYNLGVVYKRQGAMERAREELKKTLRLCDPNQDALLMFASCMQIGAIYEEQGFFDEAREAYQQAREYDYGNEDAREALAELEMKRKGEAGSDYNMSPMGMGGGMVPRPSPQTGSVDPNVQQDPQALVQAIPYLGQMLMQKFGGGGQGDEPSEESQNPS